jgi:glycosyltransferase involved in cell wall biosynthesis
VGNPLIFYSISGSIDTKDEFKPISMQSRIVHFAPIPWVEITKNGYRKTSGAMLKALWDRDDIEQICYVQQDRRWGMKVRNQFIDAKLSVIGLPIGLPYERVSAIRRYNRYLQASLLKPFLEKRPGTGKIVYWFYDWWNIELISRLPKACTVMEVTDRASQFLPPFKAQQELLTYVQATAREVVDHFFPVSETLVDECKGARRKVTVLPNGISHDFLEQAYTFHEEPDELHAVPHPRLCVVSTGWPFNYRLDHDLLLKVLEQLPDWHLILVGCEKVETEGLKRLLAHPRVTVVGLVPVQRLVSYIQNCDVCAVPYKREAENSGDRLKIYEYLACHKPVILTVNEGKDLLKPFLRFAFDSFQFAATCRELQHSTIGNEIDPILDEMTWEKRADHCLSIIQDIEALPRLMKV